jgi:type II secretory pathway pseudopilin PulG
MLRAMIRARMRARLHQDERGFTLVESVIAITMIFASVTALAFTATNGFRYVAYARERQAANGIANQVMEEIRGLAYSKIQQGLSSSALSTDSNLVTSCPADDVGVYRFLNCSGEKVVSTASLPNVLPLVPNNGTCPGSTLPLCSAATYPVTYTWRTYVTNNNTGKNPYRVTVMVMWTSKSIASTATQIVKTQSLFWSPAGCGGTSLTLHPFAAPCQPFFFGQSSYGAGTIGISGTFSGTTFQSGSLSTMSSGADIQQEQVVQIQTSLTGTGASIVDSAGTRSVGSTTAVTTAADGDPANVNPPYSAPAFAPSGGVPVSTPTTPSSGVNWIKLTNPANDAGSMDAAAFAVGTSVCPPAPAVAETDSLACGGTRVTQGTLLSSTGNIATPSNPTVGAVTFLQMAAPASATTATSNRDTIISQDGRVTETVTRTIGRLDIGGLPAGSGTPAGWGGYFISLTNYSDTVTAVAGSTAADPVATITSGTLSYWNGAGYTAVNLATTPGYSIPSTWSQGSTVTFPGNKKIVVTMTTTGIAMGALPTTTSSPAGSGSILRNDVTASIGSPMSGQFTYNIAVNNSTVVNFTFTLDLGAISARAVYQAKQAA